MSSVWWNSNVTSFFPVAHWDTLDSGISNAVLSLISNDKRGPAGGEMKYNHVSRNLIWDPSVLEGGL